MMTINDQIRDEKLQYDIDIKAAEISAKSSGKLQKYEYLTGEDILPSHQQQIIEQAKFTYSHLGKAFEKQTKTIKDLGKKQADVLKVSKPEEQTKSIEEIFPEGYDSVEIKNEIIKIKDHEKKLIKTISFIIQARNCLILKILKQYNPFVMIFTAAKLQ